MALIDEINLLIPCNDVIVFEGKSFILFTFFFSVFSIQYWQVIKKHNKRQIIANQEKVNETGNEKGQKNWVK